MMKFKSTTGSPVRISQLSGHTVWVGTEFQELDERFHSDAYSLKCVSEDMVKNQAMSVMPTREAEVLVNTASLDDKVLEIIKKMVDDNELDNFTKAGAPDAQVISTRLGQRITSQKRDALWYKFQESQKA